MGNTAYYELPSDLRSALRRVLFRSKEFDKNLKLRAWEFTRLPYGLHSRLEKVYSICEEVRIAGNSLKSLCKACAVIEPARNADDHMRLKPRWRTTQLQADSSCLVESARA